MKLFKKFHFKMGFYYTYEIFINKSITGSEKKFVHNEKVYYLYTTSYGNGEPFTYYSHPNKSIVMSNEGKCHLDKFRQHWNLYGITEILVKHSGGHMDDFDIKEHIDIIKKI